MNRPVLTARARRAAWAAGFFVAGVLGCESSGKASAEQARSHVVFLQEKAKEDVTEVQKGLPLGVPHLVKLFEQEGTPETRAEQARDLLEDARDKVQDLRVAKSTFFAVAGKDGIVIRNDREQDAMAGRALFASFPELKRALESKYVESRGSMPEAAGVRGRPDGQWVAAAPVKAGGEVRGLYVTGWSWSAYAYRMENALRSELSSKLEGVETLPLLYVYMIVDDAAYGAPVSPDVNAKAIVAMKPLEKARAEPFATEIEITGRSFGLAVGRVPELGKDVAIAVLRSET
ncbi:MAG TPA: hypothetical protein VF989_02940 [Polyangiaceae bacterium]